MTAIRLDDKVYDIEPKFEMICEVEEELGALPELAAKFMRDEWKICELVTLMHIILSYIGKNIDYMELGNKMMSEGLGGYLSFANGFLKSVIYK